MSDLQQSIRFLVIGMRQYRFLYTLPAGCDNIEEDDVERMLEYYEDCKIEQSHSYSIPEMESFMEEAMTIIPMLLASDPNGDSADLLIRFHRAVGYRLQVAGMRVQPRDIRAEMEENLCTYIKECP